MKKIICCLIVALLLLTAAIPFAASAANDAVVVTASKESNCSGETVDVEVNLYNTDTGIMTLQADVCYDANFMTAENIVIGSVGRMDIIANDNSSAVKILATLPVSGPIDAYNETADGTLVTITFRINENATGSSDVTVKNPVSFAYPESGVLGGVPVSVIPVKGSVTVAHTPAEDDGDCTTAITCTVCGTVTTAGNPNHTPAEDDGDCTTAITCTVCGTVTTAGNPNHTPAEDDGDCTTAITCTVCGTVTTAGNSNHTPAEDDGDCTSAVKCVNCDQIAVEAKQHVDDNGDGICDNAGCTVPQDVDCDHLRRTSHYSIDKPATCNEPGFGTTWVRCAACTATLSKESYVIPATNAHVDDNNDGKCDVCGKSLVAEHKHELVHTEAKAATCTENGNIEYWYCAGCDSYFTDAEGKNKVNAADVVVPAAHKVEHVAAKEATETEDGNIEYWHCPECGGIWLDADCTTAATLEDVVVPATGHVHELVYTAAKEATCFEEGNLEYWYCAGCNCYFTDAEGKYNIAYLSLMLPVAHKVEHVEAKAPTCFEEGNIEYWYCTECGYAWLDELCTKNTNLLAVILPVSHKIVHVEAKAPTATEEGNIEYWYCTECGYAWLDELCTKNTNLKAVILPATGEDINPPTGDASILYIAAIAVIATLGVAVISFKKREEN